MTLPLVSVIMPVRNEGRYITRSLGSVLHQTYPPDRLEVLVVDGLSTDDTRERVRALAAANPRHRVLLLDNPERIVPVALNSALRQAAGDILVRVDGHAELAPDYISGCVAALQATGAACVGGRLETIGETYLAQAIAVAQSTPFGVGNAAFRIGTSRAGFVDTVAFGAYRREMVERLGGFDTRLVRHQDYEFNLRLRQAGGKIYYAPHLKVRYYSRGALGKLASQYYQYGFWKARVTRENPAAFTYRHAAPPLLVLALLGGGAVGIPLPLIRWLWLVLLGLYVFLDLVVSIVTAWRRGWRYLLILPLAFAVLHLSWGLGFWAGLFSKPLARR